MATYTRVALDELLDFVMFTTPRTMCFDLIHNIYDADEVMKLFNFSTWYHRVEYMVLRET
jgi:hypothetical protein